MAGDVREVVDGEPRGLAVPAQFHDVRPFRLKVYRSGRENPPGTGPEVPRQHYVTLDETQGHVVGRRVVPDVHHQRDLVHEIRDEMHRKFETLMDFRRYRIRGERREPADAAREKRFADLQVYTGENCRINIGLFVGL